MIRPARVQKSTRSRFQFCPVGERFEDRLLLAVSGATVGQFISPAAPSLTTLETTLITDKAATLNAVVNPNGGGTDVSFEYSTDPDFQPHVITLAGDAHSGAGSTDGTGSAARFRFPQGVAVDSSGDVYVADAGNNAIRKITPAGVVTTFAGGVWGSQDGTGIGARFNLPSDLAIDHAGNIFVADMGNDTIREITPAGVVTTLAGMAGEVGSADGTASAARFKNPWAIAVDDAGNLYVADTGNNTIREITPGGVVTTVAGSAGQAGSANGTGSAARFKGPQGIAVDSVGNIYVADAENDTIRAITPGGVVTTLAGSPGEFGFADGTGSAARFAIPIGVAVDGNGNVYVGDSYGHAIRKIAPSGVVTTLAGKLGAAGSDDGIGSAARFTYPAGVALGPGGELYVADTSDFLVRKFFVPTISVQRGLDGSSAAPLSGTVTGLLPDTTYYDRVIATYPGGPILGNIVSFTTTALPVVATLPATNVASSSATLTASVNPEGYATSVVFQYGADPTLTTGTSSTPAQVLPGGTSNVSVTAQLTGLTPRAVYYFRAIKTNSLGTLEGEILSFAWTAAPSATTLPATHVTNTAATINAVVNPNDLPTQVALEYSTNPNVQAYLTSFVGALYNGGYRDGTGDVAQFANPGGLAMDSAGNLYVVDVGDLPGNVDFTTIRKITPAGVVTTLAQLPSRGSMGSTWTILPAGVAVDKAGNVYVADMADQTVFKVTQAGVVTTVAGSFEQAGYVDGTGSEARFDDPRGIAVDAAGDLFVADEGNGAIRKITPGGLVTTFASGFTHPRGVALDEAGDLYVSSLDFTIVKITPDGSRTVLAGVPGQQGNTDGPGNHALFHAPNVMVVDSSGNVFLADGRFIRKITPLGLVSTITGALELLAGLAVDSAGDLYVADMDRGDIAKVNVPRITARSVINGLNPVPLSAAITGLVPATAYYARVVATSADGTTYGAIVPFKVPPAVTTLAATSVTDTSATLNVAANPEGTAASVAFIYGTDPNLTTGTITTAAQPIGAGANFVPVHAAVRGLVSNTTYYFRTLATSAFGPTLGPIVRFKVPPTAAAAGATAVTASSATLNALVNPEGTPTSVAFAYGTNPTLTAQGTKRTVGQSIGAGTTAVAASASLSGLQAGVTYYFRAVATSRFGTTLGPILSFRAPPQAATLAATSVTDTSATLNALVNPNGFATNVVFEYSTDPHLFPNVVTTLAGSAGKAGSADGKGSAARFDLPFGMAVDAAGNVYVTDQNNDTVRKITPSGVVTTIAGSPGQAGSADGTGASARFNNPWGIAVDSAGNVYVADTGDSLLRKITPLGVVTTLAGSLHPPRLVDGTGSAAAFYTIAGLAVDQAGNIYAGDNSTVRRITPAGVVTTLAGAAFQYGKNDGTGSAARFDLVYGVAVDNAGNVYVVDENYNFLLRKITPDGVVTTIARRIGFGWGQAVDKAGNIYEVFQNTIREFSPSGASTIVAGAKEPGGADGIGSAARFSGPGGIAVDSLGNLYVTDSVNDTIRKVSIPMIAGPSGLTGTNLEHVSASLTGLTPGKTYYYRVVTTSAADTTWGRILKITPGAPPAPGPKVTHVQRLGFHERPTSLVLTFNEPLEPTSADNVANYQLTVNGRRRRIELLSATYNAAADTVTLVPSRLLPLKYYYRLIINGSPPFGLTNDLGTFLDGSGRGRPGTSYSTVITRRNLVLPFPRRHPHQQPENVRPRPLPEPTPRGSARMHEGDLTIVRLHSDDPRRP